MNSTHSLGFALFLAAMCSGSWHDHARYWGWESETAAGIKCYPSLMKDNAYRERYKERCEAYRNSCLLFGAAFPGCTGLRPLALTAD